MAFKYMGKDRTADEIRRRSKEPSGSYDSIVVDGLNKFKAKEGENAIRILPASWSGNADHVEKYGKDWSIPIYLHYRIGADKQAYVCAEKTFGEPCAVCEMRAKIKDEEEAGKLRPSKRALCWLIDRNDERSGPVWWDMPWSLSNEINGRSVNKKTNAELLIDDPEDGHDVTFVREGTQLNTDYSQVEVERDPTPLTDNDKRYKAWLSFIEENQLPDIINVYDSKHLEKALKGQIERRASDEDEDEEEEAPRGRNRGRQADDDDDEEEARPRRGKAVADDDDDDDEDEAPRRRKVAAADDDDEEEPKPRRRGKTTDEEDDEEEAPRRRKAADDDGEDEEEKPRGGSQKRRKLAADDDDEDPPSERRSSKRKAAADDDDEEDEPPSKRAKKVLSKLKR